MPERTPSELAQLLAVAGVVGIGAARFRALIGQFGTPEGIAEASPDTLSLVPGISPTLARRLSGLLPSSDVLRQCDDVARHEAAVIACTDPDFPEHLAVLDDAPLLLFVRGNVGLLTVPGVAMVGTRRPSEYGKQVAASLAQALAAAGLTVTSGMARGVDMRAHGACLAAGGATIAVLGTGVDCVYPSEARQLYNDIVANGAVVSEFRMGAAPEAQNFPRRNRIISGLSRAVVVVEAPIRSGALITADAAQRQGREVFAVPGRIDDARAAGTNRLIADGAGVVLGAEDLLASLDTARQLAGGGRRRQQGTLTLGLPVPVPEDASDVERAILGRLTADPTHIDDLAADLEMAPAQLSGLLTMLEMRDLVATHPGMRYSRAVAAI